MNIYKNEKGNITLVILLMVICLLVVIVLSQLLLSNKIEEKMIVNSSVETSYSIDSSLAFMKSSILEQINNKEIYWGLGMNGENLFVNIDYYKSFIDAEDMLRTLNNINKYSADNNINNNVYLEDLVVNKIIDNCTEVDSILSCDGNIDIKFKVTVQHETKFFKFDVDISNIEINTINEEMKITLNSSNSKINFKELGD
jgi:hypothetical protein